MVALLARSRLHARARRKRRALGLMQPLLFDFSREEKAVGANTIGPASSPRSYLHVIASPSDDNESCSDCHPLLLDLSAWTRATFIAQRRVTRRALSSRTPTSRCRCATAGRRVLALESPPGAGRAATCTRAV